MYLSGQEGHWKQFNTKCSHISGPSGTVHPIEDCHEFTNILMMPVKADPTICSSVNSVRIWLVLECGFHAQQKNWISVLALLNVCFFHILF